jgi:hypothetical protein
MACKNICERLYVKSPDLKPLLAKPSTIKQMSDTLYKCDECNESISKVLSLIF